jgi:SAM-dependent methyltransferase
MAVTVVSVSDGYSARWRSIFGEVDPARTAADVVFLLDVLPLPDFRRVLDVPCGEGRLVRALTARGYDVTGVDRAEELSPAIVRDLRNLDGLPEDFDAVVNMWASFGYFDAAENERVLGSLARRLRPGGRLVLDVHNRTFFEPRQGTRELRPGIVERSTMANGRRRCEIDYGDGTVDSFEWQLYRPEELRELAERNGLAPVLTVAADDVPSMQLVFERIAWPRLRS